MPAPCVQFFAWQAHLRSGFMCSFAAHAPAVTGPRIFWAKFFRWMAVKRTAARSRRGDQSWEGGRTGKGRVSFAAFISCPEGSKPGDWGAPTEHWNAQDVPGTGKAGTRRNRIPSAANGGEGAVRSASDEIPSPYTQLKCDYRQICCMFCNMGALVRAALRASAACGWTLRAHLLIGGA